MFKKSISLIILVTVFSINASTIVLAETGDFVDIQDDWSKTAMENAVDNGLLTGIDGRINPRDNLSRAQMAAIVNRAFGATEMATLDEFVDVKQTEWFYEEFSKAIAMGTFQGSGKYLYPNDPITREQAFAVVSRALSLSESLIEPENISDLLDISNWARGEVLALVNNGYIQGSGGELNPQGYITIAEFAQVMTNIIKHYISETGEYTLKVDGNLMVRSSGVSFVDSEIFGDLLVGVSLEDGLISLNNSNASGRLVLNESVRGQNIVIDEDSVVQKLIVAGTDVTIDIKGIVEELVVEENSYNPKLKIIGNGTVGNLIINSGETSIDGDGIIEEITNNTEENIILDTNIREGLILKSIYPNDNVKDYYPKYSYMTVVFSKEMIPLKNRDGIENVIIRSDEGENAVIEEIVSGITARDNVLLIVDDNLKLGTDYTLSIPENTLISVDEIPYRHEINVDFKTAENVLKGRITYSGDILGAKLELINETGTTIAYRNLTDGAYIFTNIEEGKYIMRFTDSNGKGFNKQVEVISNKLQHIDFNLK